MCVWAEEGASERAWANSAACIAKTATQKACGTMKRYGHEKQIHLLTLVCDLYREDGDPEGALPAEREAEGRVHEGHVARQHARLAHRPHAPRPAALHKVGRRRRRPDAPHHRPRQAAHHPAGAGDRKPGQGAGRRRREDATAGDASVCAAAHARCRQKSLLRRRPAPTGPVGCRRRARQGRLASVRGRPPQQTWAGSGRLLPAAAGAPANGETPAQSRLVRQPQGRNGVLLRLLGPQ